jgi:hypothetical protein
MNGTVMNWKDYRIALAQSYDHRSRLHAWPLLRQHKLAPGEISLRFRQQDRELQRKDVLAVKVLMETVVIAGLVLKD